MVVQVIQAGNNFKTPKILDYLADHCSNNDEHDRFFINNNTTDKELVLWNPQLDNNETQN